MTLFVIRGYIPGMPAKSGVGIGVPDRNRDRHTPRACFLLSYARAHLNYGGLCGGTERCAGWFPGYANPAQFTTRRLASSVVSYLETTLGRHYDNSNFCRNSFPDYP
ncbi:hypothetical protein F3P75_16920 [Salmonella enterica subsp. enterica]|uniref:Uncharacterized protein n=1 Tax=Salmonella enterica I TaxID=59201 RepID=A0A612F6E7_SALET|nr:hypothetical protein [Salmonella enterica subsp. enterica]ECV9898181.1 hypothetical protein [Salmonella enterica subsp. enterica]ECV9906641.1 hypothetical protein [Salmonella enterica subsp. enterica]ECV9915768.1 hypothetical protein [Salmonella enterica subsp. enterica]ECV9920606.1 hypothetical protein [Salmonella enterica subsp. enterica]